MNEPVAYYTKYVRHLTEVRKAERKIQQRHPAYAFCLCGIYIYFRNNFQNACSLL